MKSQKRAYNDTHLNALMRPTQEEGRLWIFLGPISRGESSYGRRDRSSSDLSFVMCGKVAKPWREARDLKLLAKARLSILNPWNTISGLQSRLEIEGFSFWAKRV